jgi:hypothetical protein
VRGDIAGPFDLVNGFHDHSVSRPRPDLDAKAPIAEGRDEAAGRLVGEGATV